jgi:hypothetical protein
VRRPHRAAWPLPLTRRGRAPICALTAFTIVAALVPSNVLAAGSTLVSETFANNSTPAGQWYLPPALTGTNLACLSAGPVVATTSIPNCASPPDASGNGALRLTNNGGSQVGAVFYQTSLPTSEGVDVTLQTYQYNGSGADGIVFTLAAADPSNPSPPTQTGPLGGDLGYAANTIGFPGSPGMPHGYLGIGVDVYGNYENTPLAGGTGCINPAPLVSGRAYPESVTARGPGNGTVGYCILGTTATTYNRSSGGGSAGGTISNVGPGNTLDKQAATSRVGVVVPVEVAIDPSASPVTTASGLVVPANSWIIAYTPRGTATQQTLTGVLPTTANNAALATFPPSWIDPVTKIPYQLTFGWTASTGGANEFHDVNQMTASSLLGTGPALTLTKSDNESGLMLAGNQANFTLTPGTSASGGTEANMLTVTDTLPAGMTPGTATSSSDWTCTTVAQTVTCTYTPPSPIAAGTALPVITVPVVLALGSSGTITNIARISSTDGLPATSSDAVNVSAFTASALPSPQAYGQPVTYSSALPSSATGSVTFTTGTTTLCTATLPATSCAATTAPTGTDTVTAAYSGDSNFAAQSTTTTLTITKATPVMTEAAAPASIAYGAQDSLSFAGLPGGATGTVTFASGGSTLCTATLPAASCQTATTLAAGTYNVTATYSGDGNYNGATAIGASFTVTKATTSFSESAAPASISYGTADTLSAAGLPGGATGTVTFASGGSTLCTATLPAVSCATSTTLVPGIYDVTATYSGDSNHTGATAIGASFTVTKATTSLTESAAPASVPYGTTDTLSASGLPGGATGTVTFSSGGSTLCTATLPAVSCSTSANLAPSTYPVTATYSGDSNYAGATATGASFTVTKANTTMTESASPASIGYGSQDTLSFAGLPSGTSGTVTFTSGGSTLCTALLPATSCQTATTLGAGTYNVTATYSGDDNFKGTTATGASFTVTKATTAFTESAAPASVPYGTADTLSATGLASDATGTVTFTSGGATLCVVTLPALSCATSTSLAVGTYNVSATYSGDANYNGSTATGASFTVTKADIAMTESAAPASVPYGTQDTLSVSGVPGAATGTVIFTSSGSTLCTATLPATSCQTSTSLIPGTYAVTATYAGDSNFNGAIATGASFTVTKASPSMAESAAPATIPYGSQDTLSETGLPAGATGTVTFTSGGSTLCSATLPAVSCQTSTSLTPATYDVTAAYPGDSNYNGASATGASFRVTKAATSMSESAAPATIAYGAQDTLSVTGLPVGASGTVTFSAGGSVLCTATLPATSCQTSATLPPGTYDVTAVYTGDSNYTGTTATGATFTVTRATVPMTESAAPLSIVYGTIDTLAAAGLPSGATGTLTFTSASTTLCVATLPATSCPTSSALSPAIYPVTAAYSGDSNHNPATATGASFTVIKANTGMIVKVTPPQITTGGTVTVSASGLPPGASGTVTFTTGSTVLCTATLPATSCTTSINLPPGSYPVEARYSGDDNYNGSLAVGSGRDGVLSVVAGVTVPAAGSAQAMRTAILGVFLVMAGTSAVVISRGPRRKCRAR